MHATDAKTQKIEPDLNFFFWRMKVLEAVSKRDWHNVRSYLFFNVRKFRTRCAMTFSPCLRCFSPQVITAKMFLYSFKLKLGSLITLSHKRFSMRPSVVVSVSAVLFSLAFYCGPVLPPCVTTDYCKTNSMCMRDLSVYFSIEEICVTRTVRVYCKPKYTLGFTVALWWRNPWTNPLISEVSTPKLCKARGASFIRIYFISRSTLIMINVLWSRRCNRKHAILCPDVWRFAHCVWFTFVDSSKDNIQDKSSNVCWNSFSVLQCSSVLWDVSSCFVLLNQSSLQTLFLYNIHFITFYKINLVSIMLLCAFMNASSMHEVYK